ncbi:putative metal-nicotianamine transporter YSL18 [Dichanthelium oligosanthes]|uniref:Putative metal-nicotianamine transporter YSL18 n=1 Tax=Dichanthelium oligosanthes TaxID=888268 RepID=A0A1E5VI94_9POAL|nr:putative metal-nicotianamine transporter YSL18 [Dichanthelium oligosanthes]
MEPIGDPREGPSTERAFEGEPIRAWTEQITARSVVASILLGTILSSVGMNLVFMSGVVPSLNIPAAMLSLFLLKTWTHILRRFNVFHQPFTRQENTIIQTCVVACASMVSSGSLCWDIFQWFYTGGPNCGLAAIPTFGIKAYEKGFYFNFSATYVGVGMICPTLVNISMLVGSTISAAIMLPYIEAKKGVWYNASYKENSMMGIYGYKVLISIAMMLGDGLFQLLVIPFKTMSNLRRKQQQLAAANNAFRSVDAIRRPNLSFDDRRRTHIFLKDNIPISYAIIGYIILATVSTIAIPRIYSQIKYQHIIAAYISAPLLAFCNAYGTGITDLNLYTQYAKIVILIFGFWITAAKGGVIGGLVICAIMTLIIAAAGDFMQDLKTGYLTLTSPRSMFIAQAIGTAIGCIINPIIFWVFYNSYLNDSTGSYPAPFARIHRVIALVGAGGFIKLPKYSVALSIPVFIASMATSAIREVAIHKNWRVQHYIPSIAAMSVAFLIHPATAIDMCVGSLILLAWNKVDTEDANLLAPVVASGLICGEGIFAIPYSLLGIYKVNPPMCIRFLDSDVNAKVDAFLAKQAP